MIRHHQITKLEPSYVQKKLQEFFKEDKIDEDITTITTQNKNKVKHFVGLVYKG